MPSQRSLRPRKPLTSYASRPASTRHRRAASGTSVTLDREDSESAEDTKKALRLTVKMPSSKLREATSAGSNSNGVGNSKSSTQGNRAGAAPRATRNKKKSYVLESSSSEEDEPEMYASEDDEPDLSDSEDEAVASGGAPGAGQQETEEEDEEEEDDEEEEGEEESEDVDQDADGDIDMDEDADDGIPLGQAPPILKVNGPAPKPTVTVTPAQDARIQSVENKEMEMDDDDDEELSELNSEDEDEEPDAEEEDAEGEDVDDMDEGDDSRSPEGGSRASTPDVSKLTKRQRSRMDQVMGSDFLQLPMEPQTKKQLTAEEHAMRRAEMARRRKNLSEKRNEEEKMDTINRLLKKQAPKRRGKISAAEIAAQDRGDDDYDPSPYSQEEEVVPANPVFARWVSSRGGCRVGVPEGWLGGPIGRVFGGGGVVEG